MALIRINPTKILVGGDKKAAMTFAGPARSQLEILKQGMSFQNLSQGIRRVWLNENVYVECKKIFNYQECKIWVRPVPVLEEEEAQELYFYVRIVCTDGGDPEKKDYSQDAPPYGQFYQEPQILGKYRNISLTRTVDRLILWKCRKEVRGTSPFNAASYKDVGEYEDGSYWAIPSKGSVIMDVDVISRTVYSSNNGIDVDTFMGEEAQLNLADDYIEKINENENLVRIQKMAYELHPDYRDLDDNAVRSEEIEDPEDITSFFYMRGQIINPLQIANECTVAAYDATDGGVDYEVYFDDPFPILYPTGFELTEWVDFYHFMEPPRTYDSDTDTYEWLDGQCANPTALFDSLEWPGIVENSEKYLPTSKQYPELLETEPDTSDHQVANGMLNCGDYLYTTIQTDYNDNDKPYYYPHYVHAAPYDYGDGIWYYGETDTYKFTRMCNLNYEYDSISHLIGSYYTSKSTYPCFFVSKVGREEVNRNLFCSVYWGEVHQINQDSIIDPWPDGPGWWDLAATVTFILAFYQGGSASNRLRYKVYPGESGISTPLEQYVPEMSYTVAQKGSVSFPSWVQHFLSFTGGAAGDFYCRNFPMMEWALPRFPSLKPILADTLSYQSETTPLGKLTLSARVMSGKKTHFADTFTLVRDKHVNKLKAALAIFSEANYIFSASMKQELHNLDTISDSYDYSPTYYVGILFYIMYPPFDIKVTGNTTTYWDIHSERENSQDRINHNREVDLEAYVGGVLSDIKDSLPSGEDTTRKNLLIDEDYDITTGFTHPLH